MLDAYLKIFHRVYVLNRIGRKLTIMIGIVSMATSGIIVALVAGLTTFNVIRFLSAMASTAVFQTSFVLGKSNSMIINYLFCV